MLALLATVGRILVAHWPALLALHLAGMLVRYAVLELAGWIGAFTAVGGLLILPFAVLARLMAFVAMFLVVRDSLRQLTAIAPGPTDRRERRRGLFRALMAGVLPFFAIYWAMGDLRDDWVAYSARVLELQTTLSLISLQTGEEVVREGTLDDIQLGPIAVSIIVLAFAGRWAWKRWSDRLPRWFALIAVYLEAVWVFFSVTLIDELIDGVREWVNTRQAITWMADVRGWLGEHLQSVAWAWDALDWLLGQAGVVLGQPLAWLAIAGVLYGQAIAAQSPAVPARVTEAVAARTGWMPDWLRAQGSKIGEAVGGRLIPIWRAVVLMWRAGPVLIGFVALLYAIVEALGVTLALAVTRVVGPQPLDEFWQVWTIPIFLPTTIVMEVLQVAVIAAAYDATVGKLRERTTQFVETESDGAASPRDASDAADLLARETVAGEVREPSTELPSGSPVGEVEPRQLGTVNEELHVEGERPGVGGNRESGDE